MSPSVCFASLLLGSTLLPSPAIAEHEGTAAWMQGIDKTRGVALVRPVPKV